MKNRFRKCGSCFRFTENWRDAKAKGLEPQEKMFVADYSRKPRKGGASV